MVANRRNNLLNNEEYNVQRGQARGINPDALSRSSLIFAAQRLAELTNRFSLDSYKAPTVHIPALIKEAINQLKAIGDGEQGVSSNSAKPIIDELLKRIQGNIIVKKMMPKDRMLSLQGIQEHQDKERRLKVISRELSPGSYATSTMNLLIEHIAKDGKSEIEFLCKELISTLINMKMSKEHLYSSINKFFFTADGGVAGPDCLRRLFKEVFPHEHEFALCFQSVDELNVLQKEHFSRFSMEITSEVPEVFQIGLAGTAFDRCSDGQRFIVVKTRAVDRYSAIRRAQKSADLLQNLFRMYNHQQKLSLGETVLVQQCCVDGVAHIPCRKTSIQSVFDDRPKKAAKRLEKVLSENTFVHGPDKNKFFSIIEFHGMSLDSVSPENQLLNLWISLETICPSRGGISKIESVIKAVLPVIGLNYLRRLFDQATYDLMRWNRGVARSTLSSLETENSATWQLKLLRLCALPENKNKLSQLFKDLGENELLRYRIFSLHRAVSDPKKLHEFISDHQQRVEWQIKRIYRARNAIVHSGSTPSFIEAIVDNAHDYFDQLLQFAVDASCGISGFNTFSACFDFFEWEYGSYMEHIASSDKCSDASIDKYLWQRVKTVSREDIIVFQEVV